MAELQVAVAVPVRRNSEVTKKVGLGQQGPAVALNAPLRVQEEPVGIALAREIERRRIGRSPSGRSLEGHWRGDQLLAPGHPTPEEHGEANAQPSSSAMSASLERSHGAGSTINNSLGATAELG